MPKGIPPIRFTDPSPRGYLYACATVDPPARAPFVRRSARREQVLAQWRALAQHLTEQNEVVSATVYEAVLIPPIKDGPRHDVLMLLQTGTPEQLAAVPVEKLQADLVMPARNLRRIGDTDATTRGTFLFNHFTAPDPDAAVAIWEGLAGWYTAKTGVDNSTLLGPIEQDAPYAFVNHARLPGTALTFLLGQLLRPTFHGFVRPALKDHGMVAMPILCRPA
ncbi:hypothetical protein FXF51_26585 [Nonomuraea sp. PA05]|uniref:hypothetical protein n=1 Tax=Nonomuraea sp. PA05 TaxID=2604466 RepID=UPI0011DBEF51|nr:hypothetical protein [Nonomuraea sp. PA05]TYB62276.1 hypothetical protein FXF51_26585 [Nonomuraea sp. PA05]